MSDRGLKIALIISVLVNAFLAAATVVGGVFIANVAGERAMFRQRGAPLAMVAREVDDETRARLKQNMRQVALSAAPMFREARAHRKHAAELLSAEAFDAKAVGGELAQARAAEDRGRGVLEDGFVNFLKTESPAKRARLSKVLLGRGSLRMNPPPGGPPPGFGPPPPDGPPPESSPSSH